MSEVIEFNEIEWSMLSKETREKENVVKKTDQTNLKKQEAANTMDKEMDIMKDIHEKKYGRC